MSDQLAWSAVRVVLSLLLATSAAFPQDSRSESPDAIRRDHEKLTADIAALDQPADADISKLGGRVERLAQRLVAAGQDLDAAAVWTGWGFELASRRGRPRLAIEAFDRAADLCARLGEQDELAVRNLGILAMNRAAALLDLSRHDEALRDLELASKVAKRFGDDRGLAGASANRGNVLLALSRMDEALDEYEKALRLFEALNELGTVATIRVNRAIVFTQLGRVEEALREYERAAEIFDSGSDQHGLATVAKSRGTVYSQLSRHAEALQEYERAAAVFERLGDATALAILATYRGVALRAQGRHDAALEQFDKAAESFKRSGDQMRFADAIQLRASALHSMLRNDDALEAYDEAARIFRDQGNDAWVALIAVNRGGVLTELGRHVDALRDFDEAEKVLARLGNDRALVAISHNRGEVFLAQSRFKDALGAYVDAANRIEKVLQSQVQKIGESSSASFREKNRDVVVQALKALKSMPGATREQQASAYKVLQLFMGLGMAEAIAERGQLARLDLPKEKAARLGAIRIETATRVTERDRLVDASTRGSAAERQTAADGVKRVSKDIAALDVEASRIIEDARLRQQAYVGIQYPKPASTDQVQAELEADVALLELTIEKGEGFAFVTTRAATRALALGDAKEVVKDISSARKSLTEDGPLEPRAQVLRRLCKSVLDPVLAALPKDRRIRTLLIAAHGDLARIPFEVLLTEEVALGAKPADWPFLVRSFDVAYVHSGTVLRATRLDTKRRASEKREGLDFVALAFPFDAEAEGVGDVAPDHLKLAERGGRAPLPGTAREVVEIARLFAKEDAELQRLGAAGDQAAKSGKSPDPAMVAGSRFALFLRASATEQALKRDPRVRAARIVHVACHGEADLTSPALSRLVLSRSGKIEQETGEDGFLFLRELRDLGISADLLVLSACETNAGVLHPLEGIAGLSRAGLAAGAQAVLSTLWRVGDDPARELIVDFYRRWMSGQTRIRALCDAKRAAIRAGHAMKTWSGYMLWDGATK